MASSSDAYLNELKGQSPQLAKAMELDGVKQVYDSCFKHYQEVNNGAIGANDIVSCVWGGNKNANISGISQNPDLAKQVNELVKTDTSGKSVEDSRYQTNSNDSKENNFDEYMDGIKKHREENKSLTALKDYYNKRLQETLYGKKKDITGIQAWKLNGISAYERTVDQKVFYKLHKSQLGKNIINALSSYCIESTLANRIPFVDEDNRSSTRKKNLEKLSIVVDAQKGKTIQASEEWDSCIGNIQHVCYQPNKYEEYDESGNKTGLVLDYSNASLIGICKTNSSFDPNKCPDIVKYSQKRACIVTQYLTEAKRNMAVLDDTIEKYDKLKVTSRVPANAPKFYENDKSLKSIDELTSLTSNEVIESGHAEQNKNESERLQKCLDSPSEELCAGFLKNNRDEELAKLTELKLKQEANLQRLKDIDEDDKESITKLLLSEGYSEEDATKMAEMDGIKSQIEKRYNAKKDAIVGNLADKIDKLTSKGEKLDLSPNSEDIGKLQQLKAEIESKSEDFAQLVHFNNVISGYLNITDSEGNSSRNTASLKRELESNAFNEENQEKNKELGVKKSFNNDYNNYMQIISETGQTLDAEAEDDSDTKDLSVDQINEAILNYFKVKKDAN